MRIFRKREALHGFAASRIQLLNMLQVQVDAMFRGTSFSCLLVPVMARFKLAQAPYVLHQAACRAVVLRHERMRLLAHFNCFGTPAEIPHNPATGGKRCRLNFGLLNAIACDAIDQPESRSPTVRTYGNARRH